VDLSTNSRGFASGRIHARGGTIEPSGDRCGELLYCETSIFEVLVNDNVTGEIKGIVRG